MRAIKDHAGDMMPSIILPDLDMTVARALKVIVGYWSACGGTDKEETMSTKSEVC